MISNRAFDLAIRLVPQSVRHRIQQVVSLTDLKLRYFESLKPLANVMASDDTGCAGDVRFGIIRNAAQYHTHFVAACQELKFPFRVIDLFRADWLESAEAAGCDVLLVWPDVVLSTWGAMIKDRVTILGRELGYPTVPSLEELWLYEDKRRQSYWLSANGVPRPRTWVFYDREEAIAFCRSCDLPVVFKTSFGAASSGVRIMRSRAALGRLVRRAFARGVVSGGTDRRDREWGSVLLQEYLPDVREWRLVRIGDSFLCRLKERRGDFHSGSGVVGWARPSERLLGFVREITERGAFRSMDVDVFETVDGRFLVNELQTVFGSIREANLDRGAENRGRWRLDEASGVWRFEPGDFYRNACANERVRDALERGLRRPPSADRRRPAGPEGDRQAP
jgi:glutathione synthase/RimK-type ligase-like ATP-grasp enzyme